MTEILDQNGSESSIEQQTLDVDVSIGLLIYQDRGGRVSLKPVGQPGILELLGLLKFAELQLPKLLEPNRTLQKG